ncbi:Pls/PosA family non-ribosomal peptide synthetase [Catellatospora bangladeshensis]|uniref:Pls/PosA family non-ribosomal peptide synthetase n=2 Tax=Catellatospora bangladeshensis TaxID=310355 RepID=UPI00194559CB|nr:Pls/PosA family non-ribosomal peptide synthetase [Catellatospora bangladeshensis]
MSTRVLDVDDLPEFPDVEPGGSGLVLTCPGHGHEPRWQPGERLSQLFEQQCDRLRRYDRAEQLAVDTGEEALTYDELDARANQLARHLIRHGARPGDRIALLFDQAVQSYVGMLAIGKIHAAYVPLDTGFPADRLAYIVADSGSRLVLSLSHLRDHLAEVTGAEVLCVDEAGAELAATPEQRLAAEERGEPADELAYIIYTSGSTGRPKGVAVEHAAICNFVRVAAELYGVRPGDRMYQGLTIAFDFSIEEIWVSWMVGATLVPKPGGASLLGRDLWEFLTAREITAMCCVPTLLATLDEDLPDLRFLLVSGEACPQDLVTRWHRPGRRFLNVYGPTEATVTATWTPVHPDKPVTLGLPLPTYATVILDPDESRALPPGEVGEIGIAGIGLAVGYVNRDDLTERAFIPDFLDIPNNPSGRIYRTGDLGRVNETGEIEYLGRIDTQVKIRGYRIELTEIESVLLQVPGVAQAVVDVHRPEPGVTELVGYYSLRKDTVALDRPQIYAWLRDRLPGYMIPTYLEQLDVIPMLPSDKADRKSLPPPTNRRTAAQADAAEPATPVEQGYAEVLAEIVRVDRVGVESHFFEEVGADSLLMARFCARVRQRPDLPSVSMRDVYVYPTVRALAAAVAPVAASSAEAPPRSAPVRARPARRASSLQYAACGLFQLLLGLGSAVMGGYLLIFAFRFMAAADGYLELYLRSAAFSTVGFVILAVYPIAMKWLLIGRWKEQEIPLWGLTYLRFWYVRMCMGASRLLMFYGTPLYPWYLRLLGAKIGRNVVILSPVMPICTDLLTIGDNTVIRKDCYFLGYRAQAGYIQTGRITIGSDVIVGEHTALDINSAIGDGARLGHSSTLPPGYAVPPGESWQGMPPQPGHPGLPPVPARSCGWLRKTVYSGVKIANQVLTRGPLVFGGLVALVTQVPMLKGLVDGKPFSLSSMIYLDLVLVSAVLFVTALLLGLASIVVIPRVLNLLWKPDTVYPLYSFRYWLASTISGMTNSALFMRLFGDSSYVVNYLRWIGVDLQQVVQTGSNFGLEFRFDTPFLCTVGTGTMVSDGLTMINADYSHTSFKMSRVIVGARSFVGNDVSFPAGHAVGQNVLYGTKAAVPTDGPVRHDTGLLGAPSFPIARVVAREAGCEAPTGDALRRALALKNRYNLRSMAWFLFVGWVSGAVGLVVLAAALDNYSEWGVLVLPAAMVVMLVFQLCWSVLVERTVGRFQRLRPRRCSIYDPYYWWHERLWKLEAPVPFAGTPFRPMIWRLLGVRMGKRVYDDGVYMSERTMMTIGDDCTLNARVVIQCHSQEDGMFRSEPTVIGSGATLGVRSFVHYGVTVGENAVLGAHSFLMKGEQIPDGEDWTGNPARAVCEPVPVSARRTRPVPTPSGPRPGSRAAARALLTELRATPSPRRRRPAGVAVSLFSLAECRRREAELAQFLSGDERAEADGLRSTERRSSFVISRALVRMILSIEWHGEVAPRNWTLRYGGQGKLTVCGPIAGLDLSVSHTDSVIAVAVSDAYDIGVNLEPAARDDAAVLPWAALSASEHARLAGSDDQGEQLLRLWTLKEAFARCAGEVSFEQLDARLDPLQVIGGGAPGRQRFWFHQEQWGEEVEQHWVTVAVRRRPASRRGRRSTGRQSRPAVSKSVGRPARPADRSHAVHMQILANGRVTARDVTAPDTRG